LIMKYLSNAAVRTFGLAAAYFLVGKLALLLAIPPGYATATWPASGIALAGVLHWGCRVWPGIALGSFLVNVWTSLDSAPPLTAVALPASIGAGAALQAVVGAWLVRRSLGFPTALNDEKAIGKFLFLGGPVSCLVSATVGVGSLVFWGAVPRSAFAFSWLTWWVGDTIGVLIVTPLLFLWTGRSAIVHQLVADRTAELRQSESLLGESQALAHIGSWRWDVVRKELTWSEELYRICGVSPRGFTPTYEAYLTLVKPEHRDPVRRAVERVLSTRESIEHEYAIIRPTGEIRWMHATGAALLGPDGTVASLAGTCRDITERKKAEEAQHASEKQAQLILEGAFDAFISIDSEGRITQWNGQAEATFGWSPSEAIGHPFAETVIPPGSREALRRDLQHFLDTGEWWVLNKRIEIEALHRDGHEFPIELTISPIKIGERLVFNAFLHDITERRKMEGALRASLEEKEALLKEVHHRVKNNLQIVSSLLSLQATALEDPKALAAFTESQARVRAMSMIHEALYQSGNLAYVDFGEYLQNLVREIFRSYAGDSGRVSFAVNVEPVPLGLDLAVPCALITTELVTNSFKHAFLGEAGGEVRVSFRRVEDGAFTLAVEDNGTGLPDGIEGGRSSSMGLRLVHRLANQIDATVSLERLSRGTRIALTFKELAQRTREEISV